VCSGPERAMRALALLGLCLAAPLAAQDLADPTDAAPTEAAAIAAPAPADAPPPADATPPRPALSADLPGTDEVDRQLRIVRQDPDLPGQRMEKTLRFKDQTQPRSKPKDAAATSSGPGWFSGFASWLNDASRIAVWALGAVLLGYVAMRLRGWMRERADAAAPAAARLPSHVRDLDIRPESLPDRVGLEAWALWAQGQRRAALSLLYRGALSRLVHDHAVPIRASSTEGDCLRLARGHLDADRMAFVDALVRAWQQAVYGGRDPADDAVRALCDAFDTHLAPVRAAASPRAEGTS